MTKTSVYSGIGASFFALFLLLSGCGPYRLGTTLPPHMRTVYVPPFDNRTNEPGITVDITDAVVSRFRIDGNLVPVSEGEADTVLEGTIEGWERMVLGYTGADDDEVEEYRLYIIVLITFRDRSTGEVLIRNQKVHGYTDFDVGESLPESEEEARPDAYKDLARRVVDTVISVW